MKNWKILIADGLEDVGISILQEQAHVDNLSGINADELTTILADYDAVIVRSRTKLTPQVIQVGKQLKVIGRAGVGVDNINLDAAKHQGIIVVNAPTAATVAVAELTMALMLALARDITYANETIKAGEWVKKQLMGNELFGKTLGIIGLGRIGKVVCERAKAFGMKIIVGYDDSSSKKKNLQESGFNCVTLNELYTLSDYISIHVPLTPKTRNIIDVAAIEKMKTGARIICTARGGIIDENALLEGIKSGQIAGAGLDVFENEPPGLSELISHPRVIATPHVGAQTKEAQSRAAVDIAHEVLAALNGNPLQWRVA